MPADSHLDTSDRVRDAFGSAVVEWTRASMYPWSPVFRATLRAADVRPVDAVVKRSMRTPERSAECAAPPINVHLQFVFVSGTVVYTTIPLT